MFAIGCAYAGTAAPAPLHKLMKIGVTDHSDDVKRAALINIGFLMFKDHKQLPFMVNKLCNSHNSHIRYGAAMALGVGCAGTGNYEALKLLAILSKDKEDFVRQGAFIAMSMVFI